MKVQFLRVLGARSRTPTVIAVADSHVVRWRPRDGWSCDCDEIEHPDCPHIPAVEQLLDPRVLGGAV